jgi:hypothetical protein
LLLAQRSPTPQQVEHDVWDETLTPLSPTDFENHAVELARSLKFNLIGAVLDSTRDFLMDGLAFPLDHQGMKVVGRRLRELPELWTGVAP